MYHYELIPRGEPGHQMVLPTFEIRYGNMETVSSQMVSVNG